MKAKLPLLVISALAMLPVDLTLFFGCFIYHKIWPSDLPTRIQAMMTWTKTVKKYKHWRYVVAVLFYSWIANLIIC